VIPPLDAVILGVIEGLTEFLPVSSTGHLILAAYLLGLAGESVKTFTVVIQAGALGAVVMLYRERLRSVWRGIKGRDPAGRRLAVNLALSFAPAGVIGLLLHGVIKEHLFGTSPVVLALAVGGVVMIGMDRWFKANGQPDRTIESITPREALLIGFAQCLALWPGTSRAMVTIVAGMLAGLPPKVAAEYSFLLALPTLGLATLFDLATGGRGLVADVGPLSLLAGFAAAWVVAVLAVRTFVQYLAHRGLERFGWYRLLLAALMSILGLSR
jgi:undecaprenyl-diphosphatase